VSEEKEIKQYSFSLYYTKEEDRFTLLDHQKNELGSFSQKFDQDEKFFTIDNYNLTKASIYQLQEYLVFQLKVPIACHAKKIVITGFPLSRQLTKEVLLIFENEYGNNFTVSKLQENAGVCDIEIQITQPKRTHYIQQAYLRNFSSNTNEWVVEKKKKKARIFSFDKLKDEIVNIGNTAPEKKYGQRIESIAFEESFFSLGLEKFIADNLEKKIPPILDKILLQNSISSLTTTEKKKLTKYIILTWNRPKESREYIKESYEKMIMATLEMAPDIDLPENAVPVINEDYLRLAHESLIWDYLDDSYKGNFIDRILNFKWLLVKTKNKNFFYTSDNPVIFYNSYYEKQKSKGNDFIAEMRKKSLEKLKEDERVGEGLRQSSNHPERRPGVKGIELYFPISPQLSLILIDWHKGSKKLNPQQINEQIILQANKYIYSHQSDFCLVRKILIDHPNMRDKLGKRLTIKRVLTERRRKGSYKFKAVNPKELLKE